MEGGFVSSGDQRTLTVHVADEAGEAVQDAALAVMLVHPVDSRRDVPIVVERVGAGTYAGTVVAATGQWRLDVRLSQHDAEVFRSRNRVILP